LHFKVASCLLLIANKVGPNRRFRFLSVDGETVLSSPVFHAALEANTNGGFSMVKLIEVHFSTVLYVGVTNVIFPVERSLQVSKTPSAS
jgi:hypothetical protein